MKRLFPLLLIILLFGCKQPVKQNIVNKEPQPIQHIQPYTYITPKGDRIVFLDNYYTLYLKVLKTIKKDSGSAINQIIRSPILRNYPVNEANEFCHFFCGYYQYIDTIGLANYISEIKVKQGEIADLITSALKEAHKVLKNDSLTFFVEPSNNSLKERIWQAGGVDGSLIGRVFINIDTSVNTWKDMLKYYIAREFYVRYLYRMNYSEPFNPILDGLILEGKADSYAHLIFPDIKYPKTNALSFNDEKHLWHKIKLDLQSEEIGLYGKVMNGSDKYPLWGGYTLGYHIVQSALKHHPELTPEQWTNLTPEKILEMSDYK